MKIKRGRPLDALDDRANVDPDALLGARVACGYTRADVKRRAGLHVDTLRSWEAGKARPPRSAVRALAKLYRVRVRSLLI